MTMSQDITAREYRQASVMVDSGVRFDANQHAADAMSEALRILRDWHAEDLVLIQQGRALIDGLTRRPGR